MKSRKEERPAYDYSGDRGLVGGPIVTAPKELWLESVRCERTMRGVKVVFLGPLYQRHSVHMVAHRYICELCNHGLEYHNYQSRGLEGPEMQSPPLHFYTHPPTYMKHCTTRGAQVIFVYTSGGVSLTNLLKYPFRNGFSSSAEMTPSSRRLPSACACSHAATASGATSSSGSLR